MLARATRNVWRDSSISGCSDLTVLGARSGALTAGQGRVRWRVLPQSYH